MLRINPLITTLAMAFIVTGCAARVTKGNLIVLFDKPGFGKLAQTEWFTVKTSIWTMVVVVILFGLLLARTTAGRYMYAAGGNAEAARLAGVRVGWIRIVAFMLSGAAAGLAGVMGASRILSAQAGGDATTLAFTVLAGIVVGGTSILGGEGAVWRTVVGVLFIALIDNGYLLLGLRPALRADHRGRDPPRSRRRGRLDATAAGVRPRAHGDLWAVAPDPRRESSTDPGLESRG